MSEPSPSAGPAVPRTRSLAPLLLGVTAVLVVLYAGLCKALLFYDLEYPHCDLFSSIEMSRSWFYSRPLLHDNVYGNQAAIHNFYLLLAFSPLTIPLGAYGLILGLVLLDLVAVVRVARTATLDLAGRLAVLGGLLGPIGFAVFDNPEFGFHPELCYPPLGLLLALDLREGRRRAAVLVAALVVLVKEDGAVLCAAVLLAHFAGRLWALRASPGEERRRVSRAALVSLLAATLAFLGGMLVLWAVGRAQPASDVTAEARVLESLGHVERVIARGGRMPANLQSGLVGYALIGASILLPLGRRLRQGLALLLVSSPPLVTVLVVAAGSYRFRSMLWPHRVAAFQALVLACLVLASAKPVPARAARLARALAGGGALVAASWALQLLLLASQGYSPAPRLQAGALAAGTGYRASTLTPTELGFLRCLGRRLPADLPVWSYGDVSPVFHRQSVVFEALEAYAWTQPRLRVVRPSAAGAPPAATPCRDAGVGRFAVEAECDLLPLVASCHPPTPLSLSGRAASESMTSSGATGYAPSSSARNFPVRTRIACMPRARDPATSASTSSPTITTSPRSSPMERVAASKRGRLGLPTSVASRPVAYSRAATKEPTSSTSSPPVFQ
jgi:hypothetical protein